MRSPIRWGVLIFLAIIFLANSGLVVAQSGGNSTGNGGINSIRGRIYLPNGRTLETPVKVELQSTNHPTQSDYTDSNGAFSFTSLDPGSYTIVVDAGEGFEIAREYFLIDKEVQLRSARINPVPKNFSAPIFLRAKPSELLKNEVLNAKWAEVPKEAVKHYKRGLELLQAGKDAEAEVEFRRSAELSPSFAPAHTELGKIGLKSGKLDACIEVFKTAIRYDASDFGAHLNLGIALLNQKKYDQAEPELVTAAYLDRLAVTPHFYLGIVFVMKNDLDIARKAFETARDLKGSNNLPSIHKYLGRIYMKKHLDKEALKELETYLSLTPAAQDAEKVRKDIQDIKNRQN